MADNRNASRSPHRVTAAAAIAGANADSLPLFPHDHVPFPIPSPVPVPPSPGADDPAMGTDAELLSLFSKLNDTASSSKDQNKELLVYMKQQHAYFRRILTERDNREQQLVIENRALASERDAREDEFLARTSQMFDMHRGSLEAQAQAVSAALQNHALAAGAQAQAPPPPQAQLEVLEDSNEPWQKILAAGMGKGLDSNVLKVLNEICRDYETKFTKLVKAQDLHTLMAEDQAILSRGEIPKNTWFQNAFRHG